MMVKEKISSDYMFFRFPSHYALVLGPLVAGVTNFFINTDSQSLTGKDINSTLLNRHYNEMSNYLFLAKLTLAIMCAFFITYRWTVINKDGSYGYLLTQGIDRTKFFLRSVYVFLLDVYLSVITGVIVINYFGGLNLSFDILVWIALVSFSSTLLIVSTAILLGEIFSQPELSSFVMVVIFGLNSTLNTNESRIWYKILNIDQLFADNNPTIYFLISLILGIVLMSSGYYLHRRLDVEL